jgi:hypothetical protein
MMKNRSRWIILAILILWSVAMAVEVASGNLRQPISNVLIYLAIGAVTGWVVVTILERRRS